MDRKSEVERAPLAGRALGPDPAAVSLHDALGDVESQPDAASIVLGHLDEALEDGLQLVRGIPAPVSLTAKRSSSECARDGQQPFRFAV